MGAIETDIATFSGGGRTARSAPINLMVLNTARSEAPRLASEKPTLLIVDECHRAASTENAKALRGNHAATLGLSATPERQYDEGLADVLKPALGDIVFTYGYDDARRDGVISDFVLVNVGVSLLPEEQALYDDLSKKIGPAVRAMKEGLDDGQRLRIALQKRAAVANRAAMRVPVSCWLADKHRGERTVIFHEEIAAAERIHQLLADSGQNVTLYHSRIAPAIRRDNLRLFRSGAFQSLVSCRALDEGMNVPETAVGIIAASTASTRQRIQRLGRLLRPAEGKRQATVYTLYATEVEQKRLAEEAATLEAASEVKWQEANTGVAKAFH